MFGVVNVLARKCIKAPSYAAAAAAAHPIGDCKCSRSTPLQYVYIVIIMQTSCVWCRRRRQQQQTFVLISFGGGCYNRRSFIPFPTTRDAWHSSYSPPHHHHHHQISSHLSSAGRLVKLSSIHNNNTAASK